MDTLGFGLRDAVPTGTEAAWGARLIINMDGYVDFLHNRTDVVGSAAAKAKLLALLNDKLPARTLMDIISTKIKAREINTRSEDEIVLFDDGELKVVGNANASHGYFYVAAFAASNRLSDRAFHAEAHVDDCDCTTLTVDSLCAEYRETLA